MGIGMWGVTPFENTGSALSLWPDSKQVSANKQTYNFLASGTCLTKAGIPKPSYPSLLTSAIVKRELRIQPKWMARLSYCSMRHLVLAKADDPKGDGRFPTRRLAESPPDRSPGCHFDLKFKI